MSSTSTPGSILGIVAPMTGATTGVAGTAGSAPAPIAGSHTKFLSGSGTYLSAAQNGSGSPESLVMGSIGDLYLDTTASTLYVKNTGSNTNAGWVSASSSKSVFFATLSASQTTNLATTNHVEFNTTNFSLGSNITLSTGSGQANGIFTLAAGKSYRIKTSVSVRFSASTDSMRMQWRNNTSSLAIGTDTLIRPTNWTGQAETVDHEGLAYITTSVSTAVEYRITSVTGIPVRFDNSASTSFVEITEL